MAVIRGGIADRSRLSAHRRPMPERLSVGSRSSLSVRLRRDRAVTRPEVAIKFLFVDDLDSARGVNVGGHAHELALRCFDDRSDTRRCAEIYRALCGADRVDLLLGPYSSRLARAAAPIAEAAGMVMLNHGGADDGLYTQGMRMLVGVLSPASDYFVAFARLLVDSESSQTPGDRHRRNTFRKRRRRRPRARLP